jgi:hypothetical protein
MATYVYMFRFSLTAFTYLYRLALVNIPFSVSRSDFVTEFRY